MTGLHALPPVVAKELRELGPLWLVILATLLLPAFLLAESGLSIVSGVFYALGAVALGAMSMGHEYRHRTLGILLAQPMSRTKLLAIKAAVLAGLLASLGLAAWGAWVTFTPSSSGLAPSTHARFVLIPLACGLFLAPWLTMLCRSEFGGLVFAVALSLACLRTLAPGGDAVVWTGIILVAVLGAAGTIVTFQRLQAIEGPGVVLRPPAWLRIDRLIDPAPRGLRRHSPYVALVGKELRLQLWAFAVAGSIAIAALTWSFRLDMPYMVIMALVIGTVASAEERQMGTIATQLLLPMASWKQWLIKVAVALGLVAVLGFGIPAVLSWITTVSPPRRSEWRRDVLGPVLSLAVVGLYVSSIATGRVRAFIATIGAIVVISSLWPLWHYTWSDPSLAGVRQWSSRLIEGVVLRSDLEFDAATLRLVVSWLPWALASLLAVPLLYFAMLNHRSIEYNGRAVRRQIAWLAAGLLTAAMIHSAISELYSTASRAPRLRDVPEATRGTTGATSSRP